MRVFDILSLQNNEKLFSQCTIFFSSNYVVYRNALAAGLRPGLC